jgi:Branched-chain amino acid transport system / permease component
MSSFLTGVAGAFYAQYFGIITPTVLGVGLLINLLAWMVMGGLGTQLGPIIGAGLGVYLNDSLAQTQEYSQLIWGLILVGIVALAPGGIVTTGGSILRWLLQLGVSLFKADEARPPMPQVVGTLSGMGRRARVGIDWIAGHRVK